MFFDELILTVDVYSFSLIEKNLETYLYLYIKRYDHCVSDPFISRIKQLINHD